MAVSCGGQLAVLKLGRFQASWSPSHKVTSGMPSEGLVMADRIPVASLARLSLSGGTGEMTAALPSHRLLGMTSRWSPCRPLPGVPGFLSAKDSLFPPGNCHSSLAEGQPPPGSSGRGFSGSISRRPSGVLSPAARGVFPQTRHRSACASSPWAVSLTAGNHPKAVGLQFLQVEKGPQPAVPS